MYLVQQDSSGIKTGFTPNADYTYEQLMKEIVNGLMLTETERLVCYSSDGVAMFTVLKGEVWNDANR